jgi:hypothetical protein
MALDSTSKLADAIAQYKDNLLWEGDVTKARNALEAIRFIRMTRPVTNAERDSSTTREQLDAEQANIERFLGTADTTHQPGTSFTRGRAIY